MFKIDGEFSTKIADKTAVNKFIQLFEEKSPLIQENGISFILESVTLQQDFKFCKFTISVIDWPESLTQQFIKEKILLLLK